MQEDLQLLRGPEFEVSESFLNRVCALKVLLCANPVFGF